VVTATTQGGRLVVQPSITEGWKARFAATYMSYRMVAARIMITAKISGSSDAQLAVGLVSAPYNTSPPPPSSVDSVLSLPQARLMPANTSNPRSQQYLTYVAKSPDEFAWTPVPSSTLEQQHTLTLLWRCTAEPSGDGAAIISGWLTVEFRDFIPLE